jgi:hypothetical protein
LRLPDPPGTNVAARALTERQAVYPGSAQEGGAMRTLIASYLTFGLVLLLIGFYVTGDCPLKNTDVASDVVFVLGWPVYFYNDVVRGTLTAAQLLHLQACQNGVVAFHGALPR